MTNLQNQWPHAPNMEFAQAASFAISGRYVDEQVAKGRHLDDVLKEQHRNPGGAIWFGKDALRGFSKAVDQSFAEDQPIYTKERADAVRAYTAEWMKTNEPGVTADKVEAFLSEVDLKFHF